MEIDMEKHVLRVLPDVTAKQIFACLAGDAPEVTKGHEVRSIIANALGIQKDYQDQRLKEIQVLCTGGLHGI